MRNKFALITFLLLFLSISVSACGAKESTNVKSDIIGKWATKDESLIIEYTADQNIHSIKTGENFSFDMNGETHWIEDNVIIGTWEINVTTWEVRIWGDKMELKSDDGRKLTLYRTD